MSEKSPKKAKESHLENFKIGLIVSVLSQPFEVIRTSSIASFKTSNAGLKGMLHVIKHIFALEGMKGFFRGGATAMIKSTIGAGLFFTGIENLHMWTQPMRKAGVIPVNLIDFFSACLTRLIVTMVNNPITVVKTKFEVVGKTDYTSIAHAVSSIYKTTGFRGFYKGIAPTLMRDVPWSGIQYSSYKLFLDLYKTHINPNPYDSPLLISFFGATSSVLAVMMTYPFDNLRVRYQTHDPNHPHKGIIDLSRQIYHEEGIAGFYLGYMPRLFKKGISTALTWAIYETMKKDSVIH